VLYRSLLFSGTLEFAFDALDIYICIPFSMYIELCRIL
jgi:hypothetical protein